MEEISKEQLEDKFILKRELLTENNITPEELLFLTLVYFQVNYRQNLSKFLKQKKIEMVGLTNYKIIDEDLKALIEDTIDFSHFGLTSIKTLSETADALREVYPSGAKPGLNGILWRCSKYECMLRLKKLQDRTNVIIDKDLAIEATKQFIASFNGDLTYMPILKYFIFKNELKDGQYEFKSELLSSMEAISSGEKIEPVTDWISELR